VNELNAFDGHIAEQIRDAYHVNNGMFAAPMENSRERRQQQMEFERQQQRQMEREREEMERQQMEVEREQQEMQQMEVERQQQVERERLERQQLEMREMEMRQQQMQEQHRQQQQQYQREQQQRLEQRRQEVQRSEQQQRQFQHQQDQQHLQYQPPPHQNHPQHQQHHQQYEQQPTTFSVPAPAPRSTLSHSQSFSSLHQHQKQLLQHQQPLQPPHSMYVVPPEYRQQHQHPPSPESASLLSPQASIFSSSEPGYTYDAHANPQPIVVDTDNNDNDMRYQQYWAAAPTGHSNTGQVTVTPQGQAYHHYTPDAALKGIAADDRSLQETWQSYMYNVSFEFCALF
jgi:hypothetical protein